MSARIDQLNRRLTVLMRDHGYKLEGRTLMTIPVRRYDSPQIIGTFNSHMQAAEYLIPIVRDDEFSDRYRQITADPDSAARTVAKYKEN